MINSLNGTEKETKTENSGKTIYPNDDPCAIWTKDKYNRTIKLYKKCRIDIRTKEKKCSYTARKPDTTPKEYKLSENTSKICQEDCEGIRTCKIVSKLTDHPFYDPKF